MIDIDSVFGLQAGTDSQVTSLFYLESRVTSWFTADFDTGFGLKKGYRWLFYPYHVRVDYKFIYAG